MTSRPGEPAVQSILIVDDDPKVRRLCAAILEESGYQTGEAANGKEALVLIRTASFQLVILDLSMPDMDGFEFLKIARNEFPDIKIIVMSGFLQGTMLRAAKLFGAAATLAKPFAPESFSSLVCEVLATSRGTTPLVQDSSTP